MVYAEIKNKRDTLVLGFPRNAADMQLKLSSIGIHKSVKDIPLSAQGGNDIRVRLYADSNIWNHFAHMFSENDSLADVNTAVQTVMNTMTAMRLITCFFSNIRVIFRRQSKENKALATWHSILMKKAVSKINWYRLYGRWTRWTGNCMDVSRQG